MVIERDTGLIRTTATGRVTGQDLVEYYRRLRAHPDFRSNLNEIFDAGQVEAVDVTAEDVRRLSGITEEFTKHGVPVRVAIIAPGDVEFGMSRMYEMLQVQSINVLKVFRDRKTAEEWLFDEDQ
jgi:uncharacterized protein YcaQ